MLIYRVSGEKKVLSTILPYIFRSGNSHLTTEAHHTHTRRIEGKIGISLTKYLSLVPMSVKLGIVIF